MTYRSLSEATGLLRSIKKQVVNSDLLIARIAAQFSREDKFLPIDRVARDAVRAAQLVDAIRSSQPGKKRANELIKLNGVCAPYGAAICVRDTAAGVRISLRFPEGRFALRAGTLFQVV